MSDITVFNTLHSDLIIIQYSSGICNGTSCVGEYTTMSEISTISVIDPNISEVNRLNMATKYLWRLVSPVLILFGVVGNCLNFSVAWKMKFWRKTPLFFIAVLALTDITVLLDGLSRYWIKYTFEIDIRTLSAAGCKTNLFVIYLGMQFSSWILVFMAIDRFIKTNFPFYYMRLVTVRKVYVAVITLLIILIGVNLHFFWTNGLVEDHDCDDINEKYEDFEEFTFVYIDFAIMSAVPFLLMGILNIFIFRALNEQLKFRRRSVVLSRNSRPKQTRRQFSRKLTRMLLVVSVYFLVSTVPISVYFIYDSYVKFDDDLRNAKKDVAWTILYLFQYSNYALNFVWYTSHNKVFRDKMKEIVGFKPKGFRYKNTTRRFNQRSSTVSHMTTSLDNSINEIVSEAYDELSESETTNKCSSYVGNNHSADMVELPDIPEHM